MGDENLEKRSCVRFKIPGATIKYKFVNAKPKLSDYMAEFCPVLDLSRGGIRFLAQEQPKIERLIDLRISIPGETVPLGIKGKVRWHAPHPGRSYKYQIGVQFLPYGEQKDQNYPGNLVKIIALEQKFLDESNLPAGDPGRKKDEFSI